MELKQQMGPFCQSCGMPLEKPDDFGTGSHGFRINDYCHYCFQGGAFTEPKITMKEMIDKCGRGGGLIFNLRLPDKGTTAEYQAMLKSIREYGRY